MNMRSAVLPSVRAPGVSMAVEGAKPVKPLFDKFEIHRVRRWCEQASYPIDLAACSGQYTLLHRECDGDRMPGRLRVVAQCAKFHVGTPALFHVGCHCGTVRDGRHSPLLGTQSNLFTLGGCSIWPDSTYL